ncbi:MAG: hypothetical protein ACRD3W_15575 [Terriglobales bacterium]
MADEGKKESAVKPQPANPTQTQPVAEEAEEHYEVVSEYRIGEGAPPLFLVIFFLFVVAWAMFSWVPFFGY